MRNNDDNLFNVFQSLFHTHPQQRWFKEENNKKLSTQQIS